MLTPHEFATLLLVKHAPDAADLERYELKTLLERRLIALEPTGNGVALPTVTPGGQSLLRAMALLAARNASQPGEAQSSDARDAREAREAR
ncbi:hypothetical protein QYH69_13195 [Paraburkholderia sp. SARCC-3016]|jgi:hypothetical protein|uniref:hypothetical protein n=1 Tax=Paraburkholderia sp. SARCC-3016 TaxID=3058611 RepID=UPI0028080049|nr:hypothetical protein [Paraburkholderia sp. SARCC-3016]MDQ7978200.1 hypothetical protein [Paraburkholderia sp. SARCC-3016]